MDLSVLIPTHQRPAALGRCLSHLNEAACDAAFELIIGLDGDERETPTPTIPKDLVHNTRLLRPGRVGLPRLREQMLRDAQGRVVLWLNDDANAHPGLLLAHLSAHHESARASVVAGRADWAAVQSPTLFDRVVQRSDLIFFRQPAEQLPGGTDYRNCFGLNMSFPRELAIRVGGVAQIDEHYGYEDIELAWRLHQAGTEMIYEPRAVVTHEHRYSPCDVHQREYLLGRAAWSMAQVNPDFGLETFSRDLRDPIVIERFAAAIDLGWPDAIRIERSFLNLNRHHPDEVHDDLLPLLAEHWVPLKRLLWRWGVLDASRGLGVRWSTLEETSPEDVLCVSPDPV